MRFLGYSLIAVLLIAMTAFSCERSRELNGFCAEKGRTLSDEELRDIAIEKLLARSRYERSYLQRARYVVRKFCYPGENCGGGRSHSFSHLVADQYVSEVAFFPPAGQVWINLTECGRVVR